MKRCLLICEGPFDELIFSILKKAFDESLLEIKPLCRCCADTTDLKNNVESLVSEILSREHGYLRTDFDEVCFLIDSDGIYIPDSQIVENKELAHTCYKSNSIDCLDKNSLIARNKKRRKNITDLLDERKYWIFYNSRNIEHAFDSSLSGHLNDNAKKRFALNIFNAYDDNCDDFIRKLISMNKSGSNNLFESWRYLGVGNNSLSSTSNIFIFLLMHFYALKAEYKTLIINTIIKK